MSFGETRRNRVNESSEAKVWYVSYKKVNTKSSLYLRKVSFCPLIFTILIVHLELCLIEPSYRSRSSFSSAS